MPDAPDQLALQTRQPPIGFLMISPKWGMRWPAYCLLVRGLAEELMRDQDEDSAAVIGVTVPHWLLSAINGMAVLLLVLMI